MLPAGEKPYKFGHDHGSRNSRKNKGQRKQRPESAMPADKKITSGTEGAGVARVLNAVCNLQFFCDMESAMLVYMKTLPVGLLHE